MKKTLSINIAGVVFHIEEDAFGILDNYLQSIQIYFQNFEGSKEIIADIEGRIAEKFWAIREEEKTEAISLEHVNQLIATLGTVADFQEIENEEYRNETSSGAEKNNQPASDIPKVFRRDILRKKLGGVAAGLGKYFDVDPIWVRIILLVGFFGLIPLLHVGNVIFWAYIICWIAIPGENYSEEDRKYRKFYRDPEKKVIGGVMAGISAFTGWDLGLLRVFAVISALFFGAGILTYIVIMVISPQAKTLTDKMEMQGETITLENIEHNIKKSLDNETGPESTLSKILLFPFRALAVVFKSLSGVFIGIRWFFQITAGFILTVFSLALLAVLFVSAVSGSSGFDHGLFSLSLGEAQLPLFLLSKDLPSWTFWAFIAAFLPIIVSIGMGGVSLLINRKVFNKMYSYVSTTLMIFGWIALFFAASTLGKNFSRTASVNQIKDLPVNKTPYILDIKKESQESIFEKMLGSKALVDELIDDEDVHDYNNGGFSRVRISMEGYSGKNIQVIQFSKSNGFDRIDAEKNAKSINYGFSQTNNKLLFDAHFGILNQKFRNQRARVKILIPFGMEFSMSREFASYTDNNIDGGYYNEDKGDLFVGSLWTFTTVDNLVCNNRKPIDTEFDNENNSSQEGDTDQSQFSITKTYDPFSKIEVANSDASLIKIVEGNEYKVSFKGDFSESDFNSNAKVVSGVLKFDQIQSGIEVEIQTPNLNKLELGGSARTELSGFTLSSLEVILKNQHSLSLNGSSIKLIASTMDQSELLATDWTCKNALVFAKNESKMALNVSDTINGKKEESAEITYAQKKSLHVYLNGKKKY
jgi:phage shock protein PspC (stress-responsive transcriptional regulator)